MKPIDRIEFIDVARGVLILLVVLGHTGFLFSRYIFWFHMPAFFIISGMFLPQSPAQTNLWSWYSFMLRAIKFFVPYLSYFIIISAIAYLFLHTKIDLQFFLRFFFGGRLLVGVYGTFWFITCLYVSQYLFFLLQTLNVHIGFKLIILVLLYFLGVNFTDLTGFPYIPFNADIALVAVSYLFLGSLLKPLLVQGSRFLTLPYAFLMLLLSVLLVLTDIYVVPGFYELNMKYGTFNNLVTDIVVPVTFSLFIFVSSFQLYNHQLMHKMFSYIGQNSLHIMYLHFLVIALLNALGIKLIVIYFLVGSILPLMLAMLFNHHWITRFLFNGTMNSKK